MDGNLNRAVALGLIGRSLSLVFLGSLLSFPSIASNKVPLIGVIHGQGGGHATFSTTQKVTSGTQLSAVQPNGKISCCFAVLKKEEGTKAIHDELKDIPVKTYRLGGSAIAHDFVGLGIEGKSDLRRDGNQFYLSRGKSSKPFLRTTICASREGLQFYAYSEHGAAPIAHYYYEAGYDLEPTCESPRPGSE